MAPFNPNFLIPRPQDIARLHGTVNISQINGWFLEGSAPAPEMKYVVSALSETLGRPIAPRTKPSPRTLLFSLTEGVMGKGDESYTLSIEESGVSITGSTYRALFYGVQTLRQIIELQNPRIPSLIIRDWPVLAMRGYADDMSRKQTSTLKGLEYIIRNLARLKINVYQPYMEDIIYIDKHPMIGWNAGRFTRNEIAYLVELGKQNFIDILPLFNSSGHCENILKLPEYDHLKFKGNPETLDPQNPETYVLLQDVYTQLFEQFPFEYFHMGLDEARGLGNRPDLYVKHANRLADIVLKAGRKPVMYHEMFVPYHDHFTKYTHKWLDKLNRNIVLNQWVYSDRKDRISFMDKMTRRGFSVIISPAIRRNYCGSTEQDWYYASNFMEYGLKNKRVIGMLNTSWNGVFGKGDRALNWRGLAMEAELTWNGPGPKTQVPGLQRAFDIQMHGVHDSRLSKAMLKVIKFGSDMHMYGDVSLQSVHEIIQHFGQDPHSTRSGRAVFQNVRDHIHAVKRFGSSAKRNRDLLNNILLGLSRIMVGAQRVCHSHELLKAVLDNDLKTIEWTIKSEKLMMTDLRQRHTEMWLHSNKPEGLEYLDHLYTGVLSELENLGWHTGWTEQRAEELRNKGFQPVDLGKKVNTKPGELISLPWGIQVFDNIPWDIVNPIHRKGKNIIRLRSNHFPTLKETISIPIKASGKYIHVLHALYGDDSKQPGTYSIVFEDGTQQVIKLRGGKDAADWWMPFGHLFGGGGAKRIDPRTCRLAWVSGSDLKQGYCLYHFRKKLKNSSKAVKQIDIHTGDPACSLIIAGITLEK